MSSSAATPSLPRPTSRAASPSSSPPESARVARVRTRRGPSAHGASRSRDRLTMTAEVGPAARDDGLLDRPPAVRAGQPLAPVHEEALLEAAPCPVEVAKV